MRRSYISWFFLPELELVAFNGLASLQLADAAEEGLVLVGFVVHEVTRLEERVVVLTRATVGLVVPEG